MVISSVEAKLSTQLRRGVAPSALIAELVYYGKSDIVAQLELRRQVVAAGTEDLHNGQRVEKVRDWLLARDLDTVAAEKVIQDAIFDWAARQAQQGATLDSVRSRLLAQGADPGLVNQTAILRSAAGMAPLVTSITGSGVNWSRVFIGLFLIGVGGIITIYTFLVAAPGGTYFITIGIFLAGAWQIIRGLAGR